MKFIDIFIGIVEKLRIKIKYLVLHIISNREKVLWGTRYRAASYISAIFTKNPPAVYKKMAKNMAKNPAKRVLNLGLTKSPVLATLPVFALGLPNMLLALSIHVGG